MADHYCQYDHIDARRSGAGIEGDAQVTTTCPFCELDHERIVVSNLLGIVVRDGFPVSRGHTLIIPRRHVGSFFDIDANERNALLTLLDEAKRRLDKELQPMGYTVGINDGMAAGQTVPPPPCIALPGLPMLVRAVPAGFPSPAADYYEERLSLDEHLIEHKEATFFVRVPPIPQHPD